MVQIIKQIIAYLDINPKPTKNPKKKALDKLGSSFSKIKMYKLKDQNKRSKTSVLVMKEEKLTPGSKKNETQQIDALIHFCQNQTICRQKILLSYFGEESNYNCNKCDVCREKRKQTNSRLSTTLTQGQGIDY